MNLESDRCVCACARAPILGGYANINQCPPGIIISLSTR